MKKILVVMALCVMAPTILVAQDLADSVNVLYRNYFDLLKTKDKVDEMNSIIIDLELRYSEFNSILESNNSEIEKLTKKELFSLKTRLATKRNKIINTADFVSAANVSLNAIKLLDAISDYLNEISALNSPVNEDLGFSLASEMGDIIEDKIIKGKKKVNGGKSSKLLQIVDKIIKSPISDAVTSAVPVVSSIKSVADVVLSAAVRGDDIEVDDIEEFNNAIKVYLDHYEGLAQAQSDFKQKLNSVDVRKEALKLLLRKYTNERIISLKPELAGELKSGLTLTDMINDYYTKDDVQQYVDRIISKDQNSFDALLKDNRLGYPDYAISQAKFIRDEIEALGKEYLATFESYQTSITEVLRKSKKIGDPALIEDKVASLSAKLDLVQGAFNEALNAENVNKKFQKLVKY